MKNFFFSCMFMCSLAQAQTYCDSVAIKVTAHPFYDSLLSVHVTSQATTLFSYPVFIIKNSNDTIAIETPAFFMGPMSVHNPAIMPAWMQATAVAGTISLYAPMWDTMLCSWPLQDVRLCPDSCEEAILYLGGTAFTGTVNYQLKNSSAQVIKSGVFTMTSGSQYAADTLCLYPGDYTLHVSQINLTTGGSIYYGVSNDHSLNYISPMWYYMGSNDTSFAFRYYKRCETPNSVKNTLNVQPLYKASVKNRQLMVDGVAGQPLGVVSLYSIDGRMVMKQTASASSYTADVGHLSPGIYILHVGQQGRAASQKLYIANE